MLCAGKAGEKGQRFSSGSRTLFRSRGHHVRECVQSRTTRMDHTKDQCSYEP